MNAHDPACQGCEHCCAASPPSLTVFRRRFEVTRHPSHWLPRFGMSAHGYGVGNCRTPWGAYLAWRRWSRAEHRPMP